MLLKRSTIIILLFNASNKKKKTYKKNNYCFSLKTRFYLTKNIFGNNNMQYVHNNNSEIVQ